ncbi:MAG: DUF3060 domain-containing protein [Mycobacterium sp.]|nr:DUF3060 domain-containing protein [Mycobacterium sp.]
MEPQDDPEARIRDLERPLADTAHASEMGGTETPAGYPYPPGSPVSPPPFNYGRPFPGASQRSPSGNRALWILAAFLVVGLVALAGGIAAYSAHRLSRGSLVMLSPTPSISPTSLAPSASGAQTPAPGASSSPTYGSTAPPGESLSVAGINENHTIVCDHNAVAVSGISNNVMISGHCKSLTVSGVQNSVTVDTVDTIEASGFNNRVTYHTGSPTINKVGESNAVQQG